MRWLAGLVLLGLVSLACSDFPAGGSVIDEKLYGPVGTIVIEVDSLTYSTASAVARKTSAAMDGSVVETLTGPGEKLYLTMDFRVHESQIQVWKFILRLGETDSTARFYKWEEGDPSLRIDLLRYANGVIVGSFSGWLSGTGSMTYGTQLLVPKVTMHVRFEENPRTADQ